MSIKTMKELTNKLNEAVFRKLNNMPQELYKSIVYSLPFTSLFQHVNETYHFTTEESLDNVCSMGEFLVRWQVPEECIYIYDGTQVILQHPSFDYKLQLDSSGDGDFYSHKIETCKFEE
jgi:hypothetical protein